MDAYHVASGTLTVHPPLCTTTILPANGVLTFGDGAGTMVLQHAAVFLAPCVATLAPRQDEFDYANGESSLTQHDSNDSPQFSNFHDPFFASTFPICYALAATTITAYMLVIMLFITPRSFLDGGMVTLSRRSFTNSSSGGISIGGRPWLQKVAALTVAISLTLATADTFQIAEEQYSWGAQNAQVLQMEVLGSTELKVIRLISDTFLWLAQAQTLIRLFPRQKEKIIIKWAAFALITLDVIFSAITIFRYSDNGVNVTNPRNFVAPVPALSYLFQLTLGVLYAAWVVYYAIMKKRYAFYHPLMKNICLVAIISLCSIIIPIVFFVLDISKPQFTGWGDYVRWVGAAAASVVVWEWVERIEALEREEKKDGILGRQVFDGDETLEVDASDSAWFKNRKNTKDEPDDSSAGGRQPGFHGWPGVSAIAEQYRGRANGNDASGGNEQRTARQVGDMIRPPIWPSRPAPAVTPISRTDTASAASTVYAVRYQAPSDSTARTPDPPTQHQNLELSRQASIPLSHQTGEEATSTNGPSFQSTQSTQNVHIVAPTPQRAVDLEANAPAPTRRTAIQISSTLPRGTQEPSASPEAPSQSQEPRPQWPRRARDVPGRWDVRGRLEEFAANQADKIREKLRPTTDTESLPVTVIPAPERRGTALQQVLEEEELSTADRSPGETTLQQSRGTSSRDTSDELAQLTRSRSNFSALSRGREVPLPSSNPPLWPGVHHRPVYYDDDDDDDESSFDDSASAITNSSSMARERRGFEDDSSRSRGPT
ncbi:hypothetical protein S40285_00165 [Stachybotrys chlorohalonatus IBT 40285]|uniref:PH-response regulator protein palH/RIM21 n=1 Tax=Stachybotrys chlorohalonatus (strain IBT 40285) TaxID=1283841 RepID=A0A084QU08_STAC4|nr:hypothetical protein S40285_00165 [Stachybotrys chlorohalonata IBT 40285]